MSSLKGTVNDVACRRSGVKSRDFKFWEKVCNFHWSSRAIQLYLSGVLYNRKLPHPEKQLCFLYSSWRIWFPLEKDSEGYLKVWGVLWDLWGSNLHLRNCRAGYLIYWPLLHMVLLQIWSLNCWRVVGNYFDFFLLLLVSAMLQFLGATVTFSCYWWSSL